MNKLLKQNLKIVEYLADGVGYGIEPFIKRPVAILMTVGFPTTGSCEGHAHRATSYPWIDIDHLPNFPHEIYADEVRKIFDDKVAFKKLINNNHSSRKRMEKLLRQSRFSKNFRIERYGIHHSIRLCALSIFLEEARQMMTDFTEWVINNEQA